MGSLGTATEEDRGLNGRLVPKNYFVEGYCGDEPYAAWTDDVGWHHLIWGNDRVKENKRHVRTDEKGSATASGAAVIILQECARRRRRLYEDFIVERAEKALDLLMGSPTPSWYRPYYPTYIDERARALWAPIVKHAPIPVVKEDELDEEEKTRRAFRKQFKENKFQNWEVDKIDVLDGEIASHCVQCGISKEETPKMRLGPDKRRSLCTACGLFYACMGHTYRPMGFADNLNSTVEFKDLQINGYVEVKEEKNVEVTDDAEARCERVAVTLSVSDAGDLVLNVDVVEDDRMEVDVAADDGLSRYERTEKDWERHSEPLSTQYPAVNRFLPGAPVSTSTMLMRTTRGVVEDYPIDAVDWSSLPHFTKLVTLASTGLITNRQVMADELPEERLYQRAVPYAAHSHLKRMVETGRYEKYQLNLTESERYKPVEYEWKPDQIDGDTLFGYSEEQVQDSLEAHMERKVEAAAMDDADETKREMLANIALEDLDAKRTFEYQVLRSIESFEKAAEKSERDAERERERERRRRDAEEEEVRREAEMELHGGRRVVCMKESIGYSAEDLAAYEGEEDIPDPIAITCAGHVGMLQTMCKSRAERIHDVASDKIVGGGEFERMSGCGSSKKWRNSCRVLNPDDTPGITIGAHLVERGDEKGDDVIGRRIAVWWAIEQLFYLGNVEAYNVANGDHSIRYDDGQLEDVALCMQRVKWLDSDVLVPNDEEEAEDEKAPSRLHVRPPGVAGSEEATVRVPLGGFSVYTRLKPSTTTMKHSERRKCFEILQAVRKVEADGRSLSEPFERLPSRFTLPDYYEIIKCPVDCAAIERMLRKSMAGYPNVWFFLVAMELMFTNCQRFNDPASMLYRDAEVLRGVYLKAIQERFPGHPVPSKNIYDNVDEPAWDKPVDDGVIEDEDDPFPQKYVQPELRQSNTQAAPQRKRRARYDSDSEEYVPKRKSQRSAPRDRRVPKNPLDCAIYVLSRVHGNAMPLNSLYEIMVEKGVDCGLWGRRPLAALGALLRQNPLVFRDARGGEVWELVNKVDVDTDEEIDYLADDGREEMSEDTAEASPPPEKIEMTKQETSACRSVLAAIRASKDKKGRKRADPFELLPTRKALPEYYRAISAPIDLGSIQKCLNAGGYPSTWMFCVALELMLSNCQNFNESSSTLYKDAEVLRGVIAKTIQSLYPGHPVPERDSPYDAAKCVEPRWRPPADKGAPKPKLRFTMKTVSK